MNVCDVCGKKFWHEPWRPSYFDEYKTIKRIDGVTCSEKCSWKFAESGPSSELDPKGDKNDRI